MNAGQFIKNQYEIRPFTTIEVIYKDIDTNETVGSGVAYFKPSGFAIHSTDGSLHSLLDPVVYHTNLQDKYGNDKLVFYVHDTKSRAYM